MAASAFAALTLWAGVPAALAESEPAGDSVAVPSHTTKQTEPRKQAEELGLEGLMDAFGRVRSIRAQFVETKELALLDAPIESAGEIIILPPDRLHRRTDTPAPATLIIDGDHLRFEDALGREELDLSAQPEARQFVDHMLAVLSGDLDALRERYELGYRAEGDRWSLRLLPRHFPMKHLISEIALEGDGPQLLEMVIAEADGDITRSRFSGTQLDAAIAPDERKRLFPWSEGGEASGEPGRGAKPGSPADSGRSILLPPTRSAPVRAAMLGRSSHPGSNSGSDPDSGPAPASSAPSE